MSGGNATLVNSGRIISGVGAGGPRNIHRALQNSGEVQVGLSLNLSPDIAGRIHTNTGTISIATGQTFDINQDTFNQNAGQVMNSGSFWSSGGTFKLNGGQFTGNPLNLTGTLTYGVAPSNPAIVIGSGNVVLTSDIPTNQTLRIRGNGTVGPAFLQMRPVCATGEC